MKETKFTKGDWSIYNYEEAVNCNYELSSINAGSIEVCESIENNHDSHLIKTAPKLYAFIESLQLSVADDIKRDELLAEARGEQ